MKETEPRKERRKEKRIALSIPYTLVIEGERHSGMTGNISLNGVYAETISPPLEESLTGRTGEITLQLEPESIVTECMIVYIGGWTIPHPAGVGISFVDPEKIEAAGVLGQLICQ